MLVTVVLPFCDFRAILRPDFHLLSRPRWPDPVFGHMRGIGGVMRRPLSGFDSWVGEGSLVCGLPGMAIDLPRWPSQLRGARTWLIRKACYFDGLANGRFEFLFRILPDAQDFAGAANVARAVLARPVAVPRLDGGKAPRPLEKQSRAAARLWARATVKRDADPRLEDVRAGRAFAVVENGLPLGLTAEGAPAGVRLMIGQDSQPYELFVIYPPEWWWIGAVKGSYYRSASRTLRTYLLRMLQDVEAISQLCSMADDIEVDNVQHVLNEYTRHISRARQKVEQTTELTSYCYAAFARLYPGRLEGLRREIVVSRIRPNVKAKVLDLLGEVETAQIVIGTYYGGDHVMGGKYEGIKVENSPGTAIGEEASVTISDSFNRSADPELISALREFAARVRESGNDDAEVEAECIETAAKKAAEGDEKGAIAYLKKASTWTLDLAKSAGSSLLSAYLKAHLGLP